jgi:hypothetical protein
MVLDNLTVPLQGTCPSKMGPIGCPKTSVRNYVIIYRSAVIIIYFVEEA